MTAARDRLVLALDVGGLEDALETARRLRPWFATAKVGYELYAHAGPVAFDELHDLELGVFADLKLHDIPNTVFRGAQALGRRGVEFMTLHAAGGVEMLRAGVDGVNEGAREARRPEPVALAVTVLTSDPNTAEMSTRLAWAREAQCGGVVCGGSDIGDARSAGLRTMVPGIRPAGEDHQDQQRVTTPADAIANGADWLVVGRAVTHAADPEAAAAALERSVHDALRAR